MDDDKNTDLGSGVYFRFYVWMPDRELNPQYADLPDLDPAGAIVGHFHDDPDRTRCEGGITFDGPVAQRVFPNQPRWQVQSLDPLTISPSVFMTPSKGGCGLHGFIQQGRWVDAGSPRSYPEPPSWKKISKN